MRVNKETAAYNAIKAYYNRDYEACKLMVDRVGNYDKRFWRRFLIDFHAWEYDVRSGV